MAGYIPRWFTHPQTVTHPSTNPAEQGRELNSQPVDHKSDALTTTPPSQACGGLTIISLYNGWAITMIMTAVLPTQEWQGVQKAWEWRIYVYCINAACAPLGSETRTSQLLFPSRKSGCSQNPEFPILGNIRLPTSMERYFLYCRETRKYPVEHSVSIMYNFCIGDGKNPNIKSNRTEKKTVNCRRNSSL